MTRKILSARAKALEINLDPNVYGTFAEIGAGQEVAGNFFKAGGASGTIAKTMSAYDMNFSDAIYGREETGRYVCESRLKKMMSKEYKLLEARLSEEFAESTCFFVFADTVATTARGENKLGHGWLGIRFQTRPGGPQNDLTIHVNLAPADAAAQQSIIGSLGVNLIYAALQLWQNPEEMVESLADNLNMKKVEIDSISLVGDDFPEVDNRILNLWLVKKEITSAVLFDPDGKIAVPRDVLYKRPILALRGSFRPPTLVNENMLEASLKQFQEESIDSEKIISLCEITLSNLRSQANMDEDDFLARVDLVASLGKYVLISNYDRYYKLASFFHRYTNEMIAFGVGIDNLQIMFDEKNFQDLDGGLLEAVGKLFRHETKLYVFPQKQSDGSFIDASNFALKKRLQHLYEYLKADRRIEGYRYCNTELLDIFSKDVLKDIQEGKSGWEEKVSDLVEKTIKKKHLFGYKKKTDVA